MKQHQQRQLDALRRVRDFLDVHADRVGPLRDSEGRRQLDDALARLDAFGTEQGTADLEMAGQKSRERAMVADLRTRHMQPISTFARARLKGVPDFAALTRPAAKLQPRPLVRAAQAMATAAAPHADALVRGGFPADTIAQLSVAADAVSSALADRANTKVRRVGSTKGIESELLHGREAVTMLHAVISKQFAADHTFLAAWHAARRVTAKAGAPRTAGGVTLLPASPAPVSQPTAASV